MELGISKNGIKPGGVFKREPSKTNNQPNQPPTATKQKAEPSQRLTLLGHQQPSVWVDCSGLDKWHLASRLFGKNTRNGPYHPVALVGRCSGIFFRILQVSSWGASPSSCHIFIVSSDGLGFCPCLSPLGSKPGCERPHNHSWSVSIPPSSAPPFHAIRQWLAPKANHETSENSDSQDSQKSIEINQEISAVLSSKNLMDLSTTIRKGMPLIRLLSNVNPNHQPVTPVNQAQAFSKRSSVSTSICILGIAIQIPSDTPVQASILASRKPLVKDHHCTLTKHFVTYTDHGTIVQNCAFIQHRWVPNGVAKEDVSQFCGLKQVPIYDVCSTESLGSVVCPALPPS